MTSDDMLALADNIRPDPLAMCFLGLHQTLQTHLRFRYYSDSMGSDSMGSDFPGIDFPEGGVLDRYHFRLGSRATASGCHVHPLPIGFHQRLPAVVVAPIDHTEH